jgi:hypothetical protein
LLLIEPGIKSDIVGALIAGVVIVSQMATRRATRPKVSSERPAE